MNEKINNGGPAFPRPASEFTKTGTLSDGNEAICPQEGISVRAYFAAHAPEMPDWFFPESAIDKRFFGWRWFYADAMMRTGGLE